MSITRELQVIYSKSFSLIAHLLERYQTDLA